MPLRRNVPFRLYWISETISDIGSGVSMVVFPLLAVVLLHATTFQVGLLVAAENVGWLLIGLPAGALVERWDKRRVLIYSELFCGVTTVSVPVSYAFGVLTFAQLVVVAGAVGTMRVLSSITIQAFLPAVVPPDQLVESNGRIQITGSAAGVLGPGLGGLFVQFWTAAGAVAIDAASFFVSALTLSQISALPQQGSSGDRHRLDLRRQIAEGLRFVFGTPRFRWLTLYGVQWNLMVATQETLVIPFLVRELHVRSGAIGFLLATAAIGGILGGMISGGMSKRVGPGRSAIIGLCIGGVSACLIPISTGGRGLVFFALGNFGVALGGSICGVMNGSFRQAACPPEMLSRMAASTRVFTWGALAVGGILGGYLGTVMGLRPALYVAAGGLLLTPLWLILTSARNLDFLPNPS